MNPSDANHQPDQVDRAIAAARETSPTNPPSASVVAATQKAVQHELGPV